MKNKLTVTVGIPAYNEEANILNAINSVLNQKKGKYLLKKILIFSDGSQDKTVKQARLSKNSLVTVYKGVTRKGKSFRLNQIFSESNSDILMLLDADCVLADSAFIDMFKKFYSNPKTVLVASNAIPIKSKSFAANVINCGVRIAKRASNKWKGGRNVYSFRGAFVGLRKILYKKVKIPLSPGTDAYLYFSALVTGFNVEYAKKAIVYYRLPIAISGHIKQSTRFIQSQLSMKKFFGKDVTKEYKIPTRILVMETFTEIIKNPVYAIPFILLKGFIDIKSALFRQTSSGTWEIAITTKKPIKIS